jgi:catechol 2,3-dioxygenase-like lactoylglutathione lyase family enzyme
VLGGFARSLLRGEACPGIAPAPGAQTPGTLYSGVDADSLAALDRFEGEPYELREVIVATAAGERSALAWVVREERRDLLGGEPWDRERFVADHLREWLARVTVPAMEINGVAHVFVTTGDFARARAFYARLLPFLGMKPVLDGEGFYYCVGGRTAFGLRPADPKHAGERFDQGRVGLHHVCFRARAREDVDAVHALAREIGARIVHPPEEGSWAPGYYSVLFEDPDGIRLEVNFVPGRGLLEPAR